MKVMTLGKPFPTATDDPVFDGNVTYRSLVAPADAEVLRVIDVVFDRGGKTKWHHHECDQLLIITGGHGRLETRSEMFDVRAGDVVFIPAGEVHSHGATPDTTMTHVSVLTPGDEIIDE